MPDYVRDLALRKGVPLQVVRWTHGDLIDGIWQRYHKDLSRPYWPSAKMCYYTSDLKRGPIQLLVEEPLLHGEYHMCYGFTH